MTFNDTLYHEWLQGPARKAPHGVILTFDDSPSMHKYDMLCQAFCVTIAALLICIRLFTKR